MRLSEAEYFRFLDLHQSLLLFAGKENQIFKSSMTLEEFRSQVDVYQKAEAQDFLYGSFALVLKKYLKANPDNFSANDLGIIENFQHFKRGTFYVFKYLKDYTVFLNNEFAFGVLALNDFFQDFFGDNLPTMIEATLLPFNGKITYDGIFKSNNVYFGGGYKRSLNEVYKTAKARYGIITNLPFDGKASHEKLSLEDQVRYFLKTKANREEFYDELFALIKKYPKLLPIYHQEWGRIHSRSFKKDLKELGLKKAHYAILEGMLISSAATSAALKKTIKQIVPVRKQNWVYYFSV